MAKVYTRFFPCPYCKGKGGWVAGWFEGYERLESCGGCGGSRDGRDYMDRKWLADRIIEDGYFEYPSSKPLVPELKQIKLG